MEIREGYKKTEIGVIPVEWGVKELGEITNVFAGGTPSTLIENYWGGNIRWMNSGELNLKYVFDVENRITKEGLKNSSTRLIPQKSILIGLAGQGKTRGTAAINFIELCINQSIAAIYPSKKYIPFYLYNFIDSQYLELRKLSTGDGGRGGLNLTIIKQIKIPLPPLPEQTAIATVLSDTDSLIQALEKKIAKKLLIKKGTMQVLLNPIDNEQMTNDNEQLTNDNYQLSTVNSQLKEGWVVKSLGEIGKTYGGLSGKTKSDFSNGNSKYIPFMNIMSNPKIDIEYLDSVLIKNNEVQNKALKGDLFFNGSSETPEEVGLCSVLQEKIDNLYLNSFCFGFRLFNQSEIDGLYLSYFFRSPFGRKHMSLLAQGATRYNLSKANFLKLVLKLPSYKEQTRIAQILSDMEAEIEALQKKLAKQKQLKQGLMQVLLTGKKRLNLDFYKD